MRILFINNDIGRLGGIDKCFWDDVSLFQNAGHEVYTLITNKRLNEISITSYIYREVRLPPLRYLNAFFDLPFFISIWRWINKIKPQIVHIHGYPLQIITLMVILRIKKIPFFQTVHDASFAVCPSGLLIQGINKICPGCRNLFGIKCFNSFCRSIKWVNGKRWYQWFPIYGLRELIRIVISKKWTTSFISPSKALATILSSQGFPVAHVYNFITPRKTIAKQLKKQSKIILYIGRLHFTKGIAYLLRAFAEVIKKYPNTQLQLVGDGPEMNNLKKLASELNINSNVTFTGTVKHELIIKYIEASDFSVIPSIWFENNPLAVIESMAVGKPVIGTSMGGIPELVINKKTGLLVPPGDVASLDNAMCELITNEIYLATLGQNSRKMIQHFFNSDIHLKNLLKIYKNSI